MTFDECALHYVEDGAMFTVDSRAMPHLHQIIKDFVAKLVGAGVEG